MSSLFDFRFSHRLSPVRKNVKGFDSLRRTLQSSGGICHLRRLPRIPAVPVRAAEVREGARDPRVLAPLLPLATALSGPSLLSLSCNWQIAGPDRRTWQSSKRNIVPQVEPQVSFKCSTARSTRLPELFLQHAHAALVELDLPRGIPEGAVRGPKGHERPA